MNLKKTALLTVIGFNFLSLPAFAETKITILPFEVLSIRSEVKNLGVDISSSIIEALENVPSVYATEQNLSDKVMNNLNLKANNLSDDKNSLKIGKYLESELIIPGTVEFDNGKYKVNVKLLNVKTGKQLKQIQLVSKNLNTIMNKLTFDILAQQKISVNKEQKDRISQVLNDTNSIKAMDYYNQGNDLLQKYSGQYYESAISFFDKALEQDRSYELARTAKIKAKALWAYEQKQLEVNNYKNLIAETEEGINNYLTKTSGNLNIYKSLSLSAYINNDSEKAKTQIKKALDINPHDIESITLLWLFNGSKLTDKNINKAIQLNAYSVLPHIELGKAYQKADKLDNAQTEYQEVLTFSPENNITSFNLGQLYFKTGRLDEAINKFLSVIKYEPESWQAHAGIAMSLRYQEKLTDAIKAYKNAISLNNDIESIHLDLAIIYTERGELDLAVKEYKEALRLNNNNSKTHYYLGTVYKLQENVDDAITEYKEAIKLKPEFPEAHYNLGIAYKKQDKLDEAISEYKESLKLNPNFPEARLNLGSVYFDKNKLDEAINEYKEAIKIKADYPRAYNNLGSAYEKQGKLDLAIAQYKQAIKLDPKYGSAYYNLSEIYKQQKKTKEALEELKKACEAGYKPACM